jgi:ESX secretion system protein EccD
MAARDVTRRGGTNQSPSGLVSSQLRKHLAITVHGPLGSIDLVVPPEAAATDVAREYAAQAGLGSIPLIYTELGEPLAADTVLVDGGVDTGDVLVASTTVYRPATRSKPVPHASAHAAARATAGPVSELVLCLAAAVAVLGGWFAALSSSERLHGVAVGALVAGALVGVLPVGVHRHVRALAAPAFAGAAAFALVAETDQAKLPLVLGIAGLAAAVVAAVARALDAGTDAAARVWIATGGCLFVLTVLATLADLPPRVTWSGLLLLAMLAARLVPGIAVDVPDSFLIDMDRLAITAWSARERPRSRRGRIVVPEAAVVAVAARGAAIITASAAAILAISAVSAPLLLVAADLPIDRVGARLLVLLCGGGLLLSARSYRHTAARQLLRLSGVACWVTLAWALVPVLSDGQWLAVSVAAVALALLMVMVAVATGRGWRSAWWSRRAEVAESMCGAFAIAAVVVAAGYFRILWESTS